MASKKILNLSLAVLLGFTSALALAHPGHGGNEVMHDLEHLSWMLGGVVVCVVAAVFYFKGKENDDHY